eukprot:CAMPEP_0168825944 /NCGR_PEP_ID=MMETSP0726-20121227/11903_1 /TAXON_ID=265536 /ORGANISM="Amphiprora sp., Strain CCMP467" /LENGTH=131 /DNA_ID=CAMNT_0008879057 /DNA_START=21 /DNA_END=416 /DNA_ORIENTATION=+
MASTVSKIMEQPPMTTMMMMNNKDEEEGIQLNSVYSPINNANATNTNKNQNDIWVWDVAEEVRFVQQEAYEREWGNYHKTATTTHGSTTSSIRALWWSPQRIRPPHSLASTQALYWPVWVYVWLTYPFQKK